jgi:hypothetical protein
MRPAYHVIGIIGAQSSGKSTLLNKLFNSNFDVMKNEVERKQTTRGIWAQMVPEHHFLIVDIEGSDSRERWEEKTTFERRTALFGLAISNILFVNIWLNDIGRFGASNYEIIRTIFELNMQLFDLESPKKMVFVVRDWFPRENEERIKTMLVDDMRRLWTSIKKTEGQSHIDFDQVFQFEFVHLRSLKYEEEEFDRDVAAFKDRLVNPSNPQNMWQGENFKNIPIDSFFLYMAQTWDTIEQNKDLNIPNQKIMISNYRCTEIKEESVVDFRQRLAQLQQQAETKPDFDISNEIKELMNTSLEYFDTHTQSYDDKVAHNVKGNLVATLEGDALTAFKPQNEKWIRTNLESLERLLKRSSSQSTTDVSRILKGIVDEKAALRHRYRTYIGKYSIDPVKVIEFLNYFDIELNGIVSKFLSSSTQTFCKKMIRGYITDIDERISLTYMNFTRDSWDQFNSYMENTLHNFTDEVENLKRNYSDVKTIFTDEVVQEFKEDLVATIKSLLKNKQTFIFEYLMENFKAKFETGANGQPRMWRHLSDNEITELFKKAKAEFVPTLKLFDKPVLLTFDNEIVMSIDEALRMKKRFEVETNNVLEEVFNKKYNRNAFQKIPKWMWFVLAYFMHDNVLEWMRNPILFFFIVFVASLGGYLYFTNKIDYVMNWWNLIRSFAVQKIIDAAFKGEDGNPARGSNENAKQGNEGSAERVSTGGDRPSDQGRQETNGVIREPTNSAS